MDGKNSEATSATVGCILLPGVFARPTVRGIFGDPQARVIFLKRRSKKRRAAVAVGSRWAGTTARSVGCAIFSFGDTRIFLELEVRRVDYRRTPPPGEA